MEEQYYVDRLKLRQLMREHPDWKQGALAEATKRSVKWVKKWRKRLREAEPEDEGVLWGLPRTPHRHKMPVAPKLVEAILDIRDHPPEDLKRVPGPKAILYYLHHNPVYQAFGEGLPR